ncbi:hypothetical protein ACFOHY_25885 [Rhizobium rosettiformans]|uniref:hypothetical protein n=1 Tax=Rhizobium rosettiformans TaxID=1368430 RepID=UPI003621677E
MGEGCTMAHHLPGRALPKDRNANGIKARWQAPALCQSHTGLSDSDCPSHDLRLASGDQER